MSKLKQNQGWPNPSLLPRGLVKGATQHVLSDESIALPALLYGPDPGDTRLREALASWLSDFYGPEQPIDAARITITGGASQNLGCLLQTFTDPVYTRNVWIVSPTYMLVFRILDDAGLHHKLRAIPEDDEGIDIGYLRRELDKSEQKAKVEGNDHPVSAVIRLMSTSIVSFERPRSPAHGCIYINLSLLKILLLPKPSETSFSFVNAHRAFPYTSFS